MKKILITLIVAAVCVSLTVPPVWAGSKQRRRWEGVAIGVGAAILGHALIKHHERAVRDQERVVYKEKSCFSPPPPPVFDSRPRRGHWEVRKTWVPPAYKKVWNPGHYNRKGRWIPGQWIKIESEPGRWVKERVWVGAR